jgi:Protein of unknown function (DUF982)
MEHLSFRPVIVETDRSGKRRRITSVDEAYDFLIYGWPAGRGLVHSEAQKGCVAAMTAMLSTAEARVLFVEATIEADIYVGEE